MTDTTKAVLSTLLSGEMYGREVLQATGLKSGTLHPILSRLESHGWVSTRWEEPGQESLGRPRRCYYRLTGDGVRAARTGG